MTTIKYNKSAQPVRERKCQEFDREKIFIKKAGKEINVYDMIQANSVDTDIYKTLEKYGSIESMYKYDKAVFGEFDKLYSLTDILEIKKQADNLWLQLPAGVREQFHNNVDELLKNGQKWLETEKAKEQTQTPEIKPANGEGAEK